MASETGGGVDRQGDEHMSDAGGGDDLTAEELKAALAASEAARAAAEAEAASLRSTAAPKSVVNAPKPYSGKKGQTWSEWLQRFLLYAAAVGLAQAMMGPVLLTYIDGSAMQHLSLTLGDALSTATVLYTSAGS